MTKNLTPKRAADLIDVAKQKGVKSGAIEYDGVRMEFNFTNAPKTPVNEWDEDLGTNPT